MGQQLQSKSEEHEFDSPTQIFSNETLKAQKVYIHLNKPIHKQLTLLKNWSLLQIRQIFEKHYQSDYPVNVNKDEFRDLLGLEKQTSDYMFCKLAQLNKNINSEKMIDTYAKTKSQAQLQQIVGSRPLEKQQNNISTLSMLHTLIKENKTKKWNQETINIYEILTGLITIAYANYHQKVRFIYSLFDFDGNQAIDQNEITIMFICFCKGWERFTGIKMPKNNILEAYGELIYSAAETIPDGKISISDLGHWCEVNQELMAMLSKYEPPVETDEKDHTFLYLQRNSNHLVICSQRYLQKRAMLIKNEFYQNQRIEKLKQSMKRLPLLSSQSETFYQQYDQDNNLYRESITLPVIIKQSNKNILTVKGKTYKKSDIVCYKKYFDSIDEDHTGQLTLDQYVRSISKSDYLRRIAVSLFNFLDKDQNGSLSFEEMLYKIIPGAKKEQVNKMMSWIKEEQEIQDRAITNYKIPQNVNSKMREKKIFSFVQMRDYIHVFVNLDQDLDGYITYDNFKKGFEKSMNKEKVLKYFWDNNKFEYKKIDIFQFLDIIKPRDFIIQKESVRNLVKEYQNQLVLERRQLLISSGQYDQIFPKFQKFQKMQKLRKEKEQNPEIQSQQQFT